ncbi:MAG: hypothetical protein JWQ43_2251 [Glaciihabitans sp.]|nr:hypothetical protein [Glaciihabitans sp.]
MGSTTTRIAIIGTGPRGLAVALRLLDDRPWRDGDIDVHLIDPVPGGAVWDRRQDTHLLMNSRGRQATVFADATIPGVSGDSRGPSFIQWCREIAPTLALAPAMAAQANELTDNGFASRALFGEYMTWVLREIVGDSTRLHVHPQRAVDLETSPMGVHRITLDDPAHTIIEVDAAVLALGHLPMPGTSRENERAAFAAAHGLVYLAPQAADPRTLADIRPGQPIAVLGAGLNFYDVMALLTEGRGGQFVPAGGTAADGTADGSLRYVPSGREPVLHIASGRGIPYMARADNPEPVTLPSATESLFSRWATAAGTLSFTGDVWPQLITEMGRAWTAAGGAGNFDITAMLDPYAAALAARTAGTEAASPVDAAELSALLRDILARDVASAAAQPRGPATAVGEVLAHLKDRVRSLVAAGAFDPDSVAGDLQGWFRSVGAFVAAGPPLRRVREAVALLDAGILHALGADARLELDPVAGTFTVATRELPEPLAVTAVIEARLPAEDAGTTSDPLVASLLARGLARLATLDNGVGPSRVTEGLEVVRTTPATLRDGTACRLVSADGHASPSLFLLGLPVQPQEWNIANLPQPDRGDRTLTQAESIASQLDHLLATPIYRAGGTGRSATDLASAAS